jgi:small GTP-binding protein
MKIWEVSGDPKHREFVESYCQTASIVAVLFDVTNPKTFQSIPRYLVDVRKHSPEGTRILLVGNKIDLPNRKISTELASTFARNEGLEYWEVSALSGAIHEIIGKRE